MANYTAPGFLGTLVILSAPVLRLFRVEEHMTQKSLRRILIAATLTLAASAAFSQDTQTTATIPFAFRAVGNDLPAGQYKVLPTTGSPALRLLNTDTGKSVFIHAKAPITASKAERPRLIFQCGGEEGCALAMLWSGADSGLTFATPKLTANQRERRETVYLDRFKAK
jgi:hypothetical protein